MEKRLSTGKGRAGHSLLAGQPVPSAALFPSRSPPRSARGNGRRELAAGQEQEYVAGGMKAAGTTHPTTLPCPAELPCPWGPSGASQAAPPAPAMQRAGMGTRLGITVRITAKNHCFTFPSQLEVPTPNQADLSWHQSLLPSSSTAQPWSRKVQREMDMKKQDFSLEKLKLACTAPSEMFPRKNGCLGTLSPTSQS